MSDRSALELTVTPTIVASGRPGMEHRTLCRSAVFGSTEVLLEHLSNDSTRCECEFDLLIDHSLNVVIPLPHP